jgi:hypothetical protein
MAKGICRVGETGRAEQLDYDYDYDYEGARKLHPDPGPIKIAGFRL